MFMADPSDLGHGKNLQGCAKTKDEDDNEDYNDDKARTMTKTTKTTKHKYNFWY